MGKLWCVFSLHRNFLLPLFQPTTNLNPRNHPKKFRKLPVFSLWCGSWEQMQLRGPEGKHRKRSKYRFAGVCGDIFISKCINTSIYIESKFRAYTLCLFIQKTSISMRYILYTRMFYAYKVLLCCKSIFSSIPFLRFGRGDSDNGSAV